MGDEVEVVSGQEDITELKKSWWLLALLGVLSIVFGGLLIFWPGQTIIVVTTVVGLFMVITGLIRFFVSIFDSQSDSRWLLAIVGIVGIVIGVIILKNPETTIKVVVLVTAIFWLVGGLVDLFRGLTNSYLPDRSLRIVFGAMTALFGVVVLVWPEISVGVFAVLMGIYVVFFGIVEIVAAFMLKRA